jgi:hypothetical protein
VHRRHNEGLFERGSNVVDYWLAHCEGFDLGRSASGRRVTGVVCDQRTGHARTLMVRSRARRTHMLPAQAISAVDPFNKVLYLEPRRIALIRKNLPRASARYAADGMRVARHWLVTLRAFVKPHARNALVRTVALGRAGFAAGTRYCADGAVWLRPRLRVAARETAVLARRGARAGRSNTGALATWVRRRAPVAARRALLLLQSAVAAEARGRATVRRARVTHRRAPLSARELDAGGIADGDVGDLGAEAPAPDAP